MKPYSLNQLQKELITLEPKKVLELCVQLAKYKKENKEFLSYLLFGSNDEKVYLENVKKEMDTLFLEINRKTTYTTKKGLQRIVKIMNRYIKNSSSKQTELELRIYFCIKMKASRISLDSSAVIRNMYYREKDKIKNTLVKLHEDLQYDYQQEIEKL
jgi:hypothetical protein